MVEPRNMPSIKEPEQLKQLAELSHDHLNELLGKAGKAMYAMADKYVPGFHDHTGETPSQVVAASVPSKDPTRTL